MVTREERTWVIRVGLLVMFITTLPYLLGYFNQGSEWKYSGFVFGLEDGNSYIAKMLSGASGNWLFYTPYTAYPQNGFIAFLPYLLLGKLTSPPAQHDQLVGLFHLFRFGAGLVAFLATYNLIAIFIRTVALRKVGTLVAVLGGGLGWLSTLGLGALWGDRLPLEYYSPETFGFLSILGLPHLALARALLLWGLSRYINPDGQKSEVYYSIISGLIWFLLSLIQPLTAITGWLLIGVHIVVSWIMGFKKSGLDSRFYIYIRRAIFQILISSPIIIYTIISIQTDNFLREWTKQNLVISPQISDYLLAYLPVIAFSFLGMREILKIKNQNGNLLVGWIIILPILIYIPFNLSRRLLDGTWVIITILAFIWLEGIYLHKTKMIIQIQWVTYLSSFMILLGGIQVVQTLKEPVYLPALKVESFNYLGENALPGSVVLGSYLSSNPLPAWAPVQTVTGHGSESIFFQKTQNQITNFYSKAVADDYRREFIHQFQIKYIVFGPDEEKLGNWQPTFEGYIIQVYQNDSYKCYKVVDFN